MINRVCVAVFNWNKDKILMVKHIDNNREYWTLPGGGIEKGETPEMAAIREVKEETNLNIRIVKNLFDDEYFDGELKKVYRCFLGKKRMLEKAVLGYDPEQVNLPNQKKMLQDCAWKRISEMKDDIQVSKILEDQNINKRNVL